MNKIIDLKVSVDIDDVIDYLATEKREHVIAFVKSLDATISDYDFTKDLRDYFTEEIRMEDEFKISGR